RVAPQIDIVLFSHPTVEHVGAYTYAYTQWKLRCPAYAAYPVLSMGRLTMQDLLQSRLQTEPFDAFSIDDINEAFDHITSLRHRQPVHLTGKCQGISIAAYAAGHTVGGTIWKISKDTDSVVYAVDYNQIKELHLNGSELLTGGTIHDQLSRPSLLITDTHRALTTLPPRKQRETLFLDTILPTLTAGHQVLIPTDSSARILELCYMVEQMWTDRKLKFPVYFLSHRSEPTFNYAKTMLEWMGPWMTEKFTQNRESPFDLIHVKLIHRLDALDKHAAGPLLVLASGVSLETGFARTLFARWATQPDNLVMLYNPGPAHSLAHRLYTTWTQRSGTSPLYTLNDTIDLTLKYKVYLKGAELAQHFERERRRQEQAASEAALQARHKTLMEEDKSDESDEDMDDTDIEKLLFEKYDLYVREPTLVGGVHHSGQSFRMFPFIERRKQFDDYGEILDRKHFEEKSAEATDTVAQGSSSAAAGLMASAPVEPPFKYTTEQVSLPLQCRLAYVDFTGLADGRSVVNILNQWGARKLILVHGNTACTDYLAQLCFANELIPTNAEIFTPNVGETLTVASGQVSLTLTLSEALFANLRLQPLQDYKVGRVSGLVHQSASARESGRAVLEMTKADQAHPFRPPVFIGNPRLTQLRQLLIKRGFTADFKDGGVLVCNNSVAIRKVSKAQDMPDLLGFFRLVLVMDSTRVCIGWLI
ncbi:beta-lactamase-like protein, partial [Dimargaris cristalligena]